MTPVYRFKRYDISQDKTVESKRFGTKDAIARVGGIPIETTLIMVDEANLSEEEDGMTKRDFKP